MAIVLADPHVPLDFKIERNGQIKHLSILPENNPERGVLMIGMMPARTRVILASPPGADLNDPAVPRAGDRLVEINGQKVTDQNANDMFFNMIADPGKIPHVIVERPTDRLAEDSPGELVEINIRPMLHLAPSDPGDSNSANVLGLSPLMRFDYVEPDGRAALAGVRAGDTIIKIGDIKHPTRPQIARAIQEWCTVRGPGGDEDYDYVERDVPIVVQRAVDGKVDRLVLRPKVRRSLFGRNGRPRIGASFDLIADELPRVGGIVPEIDGRISPAAEAGIPAGSYVRSVNDVEVSNWIEMIEAFRGAAGQTVTIAYLAPDRTAGTAQMRIPHSLRSKMGLPVASPIISIDGQDTVKVELNGRTRTRAVSYWLGLRAKLQESVGKTVTVRYAPTYLSEYRTAEVEVTEDMIDPWMGRIGYLPNVETRQARKMLGTSNPIEAIGIGLRKTSYFVLQVYTTMERMIFTRSVGVEHLAGPVGIVKMGSDFASVGFNQLLFFLAIISANLAVINFLPLPIVDGGLMVFLMIEKIKGTPVSIRTQVVTQVIGLFLIIAAFLFVTYQDLQRLWG